VQRRQTFRKRWSTAIRWPAGIGLTAWRYLWRTTAVHRWELSGSLPADAAPKLPGGVDLDDVRVPEDGEGPLVHRIYRARIIGSSLTPEGLMERIVRDLNLVAPSEFATFQKIEGEGPVAVGDEYLVRMPGPWDGPVRVVAASPTSFRLVTLAGHLEAGQIEFRSRSDYRSLGFEIESWARSGDPLADALYSHMRLAKEIQLHMWTSVLEKVVGLSGGRTEGGITITTRRIDAGRLASAPPEPLKCRTQRKLNALSSRPVNFDVSRIHEYTPENGWHRDDMIEALPFEGSGPPAAGGSWQVARRLMLDHQLADPGVVSAIYYGDEPLPGRDILLRIRFAGLRFSVGVRFGEVYEETREVDGRPAHVFGWLYRTLEGHFEQGQMHYELWKWLDSGNVEFRLFALSRAADTGSFVLRTGFRLVGRTHQLRFYRQICRRARRLTEAQLETEAVARRTQANKSSASRGASAAMFGSM
jgi:uncharacterized protein (UPF0548 family)